MDSAHYTFREPTRDDLPMLRRWLSTPEVVHWWGDPAHEEALIVEDFDNEQMAQSIVSFDGEPFAYAQAYEVHAWPQSHFAHLPRGSHAIDTFVGEPAMLGRGHGSAYLRALATKLLDEGATVVAIDPDADNERARRAYARAGFVGDAVVTTDDGDAVVVMVFDGNTPSGARTT